MKIQNSIQDQNPINQSNQVDKTNRFSKGTAVKLTGLSVLAGGIIGAMVGVGITVLTGGLGFSAIGIGAGLGSGLGGSVGGITNLFLHKADKQFIKSKTLMNQLQSIDNKLNDLKIKKLILEGVVSLSKGLELMEGDGSRETQKNKLIINDLWIKVINSKKELEVPAEEEGSLPSGKAVEVDFLAMKKNEQEEKIKGFQNENLKEYAEQKNEIKKLLKEDAAVFMRNSKKNYEIFKNIPKNATAAEKEKILEAAIKKNLIGGNEEKTEKIKVLSNLLKMVPVKDQKEAIKDILFERESTDAQKTEENLNINFICYYLKNI